MKLNRFFILTSILFIALSLKAQQKNESELLGVIEKFKSAIKNKQIDEFKALLLNDSIPWVGIQELEIFEQAKKKYPKLPRVQVDPPMGFINFVANYKGEIEEKMFNLNIQSDSVLATICFDYEFWKDKMMQNKGKETWNLLKVNNEWKIAAVYYSSTK
jgi:hypothetical protein